METICWIKDGVLFSCIVIYAITSSITEPCKRNFILRVTGNTCRILEVLPSKSGFLLIHQFHSFFNVRISQV